MAQEKCNSYQTANSYTAREEQSAQRPNPKHNASNHLFSHDAEIYKTLVRDRDSQLSVQEQISRTETISQMYAAHHATYQEMPEKVREFMYSFVAAGSKDSREEFYQYFCEHLKERPSLISNWLDAVLWVRIEELLPFILEGSARNIFDRVV